MAIPQMTIDHNIHNPELKVTMMGLASNRVMLHFGDWPSGHTTWFMKEEDVQTLIDNLLKAQMEYIKESKNEPKVS